MNESISDSEFSFQNRTTFRKDRNRLITNKTQGGGVLLLLRDTFIVSEVKMFDEDQEALCVRLKINAVTFLNVVVAYFVPESPSDVYERFFDKIECFLVGNNSEFAIVGDFNIPCYVNALSCNNSLNLLKSFLSFNNLIQLNHVRNHNNVILDLVIASFENVRVDRTDDSLLPVDIHHPCLSICLETGSPVDHCKVVSTTKFNFKKADFQLMYRLFESQSWAVLDGITDVNMAIDSFYDILYNIFQQSVPKSTQIGKKYPVWFNREIIKLIKQKHIYFLKSKKTKSNYWRQKYITLRSTTKYRIKLAYGEYLQEVESGLQSNPKLFWSYLRGLKDSPDILQEMVNDDKAYVGSQGVADGFADFFRSVYVNDNDVSCTTSAPGYFFCDKSISTDDIARAIKRLKGNRAIGSDGIPAYILKGCSQHLLNPLQVVFNLIIKRSVYPDKWKISKVIPIYKSGIRQDIKNYRPISILSSVSKIFELIVFELLFDEISGKIASCQHGFFPHRSTFTNLATFSQYVHEAINNKSQVDVIYTDMEKAFDRVRHCVIIESLRHMDVSPHLIGLTQSYLGNRFQYVEVKGCKSCIFKSTSGVPQGSNLGPLLFLATINDIVGNLDNAMALLFADDFKCFLQVNSVEDCELLQNDFCNVTNWCDNNGFNMNVAKCACMSFTLNHNVINYDYKLNGAGLERVSQQRDLGVVFDPNLSFSSHIASKIEGAQRVAGFISRNTKKFKIEVSLHLFDSLVVPILEYASIIWSPQYNVWVTLIERVQRKFLKCMYFRKFGIYPQRGCDQGYLLSIFNRLSLSKRRDRVILCTMFRILKGSVDCPEILAQLPFAINRLNSRKRNVFYLTCPRTNLYKNSPVYKMCQVFNLYAFDIDIDTINIKTFKRIIDGRLSV